MVGGVGEGLRGLRALDMWQELPGFWVVGVEERERVLRVVGGL